MIPSVAASERGIAQTNSVTARLGLKDRQKESQSEQNRMEWRAKGGESPVREAKAIRSVS